MVPIWLIVGVIGIALLVIVFKTQDLIFLSALIKKYIFTVLFLGISIFLVFSVYYVAVNNAISLTSKEGIVTAGKVYFVWLKSFFSNLAGITGYATGQDWFLTNSTG